MRCLLLILAIISFCEGSDTLSRKTLLSVQSTGSFILEEKIDFPLIEGKQQRISLCYIRFQGQNSYVMPRMSEAIYTSWLPYRGDLDRYAVDHEMGLWILLKNRLLCSSGKEWRSFPLPKNAQNLSNLLFFREYLWCADQEHLYYFHPKYSWWQLHKLPSGTVFGEKIRISPNSRVSVYGNAEFDVSSKSWTLHELPVASGVIYDFLWDSQGSMWLLRGNELFYRKPRSDWVLCQKFATTLQKKILLFGNHLVYLGRGDGLYAVNKSFEVKRLDDGVNFEKMGLSVLAQKDLLWINTFFGIYYSDGEKWYPYSDYRNRDEVETLYMSTIVSLLLMLIFVLCSFLVLGGMKRRYYRVLSDMEVAHIALH